MPTPPELDAFETDLPDDIRGLLADADAALSRPEAAERAFDAALARAPDNLSLRIAAYTFYFYSHRLEEAIPHAEACLGLAASALGLPADWRQVRPDSANFDGFERPQRVYLKSLVALGYCRARLGELAAGEALLRHAASLDPQDRVGAGRLADVVAGGGIDAEEDA